ncbi:J517_1871 family lipoprotein [Marinobacter algicola]|uniref:Lipoprotein n=1 Tax=Marinobacter algicola DG893 TaxID=443152 RepID=A6F0J0_9GAMM|nr:J517_1871 family lipoprotein [Marinobacter algicola]EDM47751.1 hypothetical protein MDG893_20564 [Marinobacter algicola DG893]
MKKISLLFFAIGLGGCVSSPTIPDATEFVELNPDPPPPASVGLWTGAMGPYISTIEITESGRGRLCSSYASWEGVMGVKYSSGQLHHVGFGSADISIEGPTLVVDPDDTLYPTYRFKSDLDLVEAADYCKAQLGSG